MAKKAKPVNSEQVEEKGPKLKATYSLTTEEKDRLIGIQNIKMYTTDLYNRDMQGFFANVVRVRLALPEDVNAQISLEEGKVFVYEKPEVTPVTTTLDSTENGKN